MKRNAGLIKVSLSNPSDHVQLAALFEEMQAHYEVSCPPREEILQGLRDMPDGTEILVAGTTEIVGFAAFSSVYPGPGLQSGLFLKELFVSKQYRSSGAGTYLMQALARLALERGYKRVDWTADRNNPQLLAYYDGFGATPKSEKLFYRLDGDALAATAAGDGREKA
ncbi:GNAT family N-acetyltransferase [Phyllobacterium sp. 628]|uniref:GNAT family N-acetyltransferase n=1 Tax=Phyllobacterium sp. 628 TaxID=2718938 RepID=UPI001FCE5A1B|nr:GNAT family N-acetyltransferase [Phyllobacterium sp. 628]